MAQIDNTSQAATTVLEYGIMMQSAFICSSHHAAAAAAADSLHLARGRIISQLGFNLASLEWPKEFPQCSCAKVISGWGQPVVVVVVVVERETVGFMSLLTYSTGSSIGSHQQQTRPLGWLMPLSDSALSTAAIESVILLRICLERKANFAYHIAGTHILMALRLDRELRALWEFSQCSKILRNFVDGGDQI